MKSPENFLPEQQKESPQSSENFDSLITHLQRQIGLFNSPEAKATLDHPDKLGLLRLVDSIKTSPIEEREDIFDQIFDKLKMIQVDDQIDKEAKIEALSLVARLRQLWRATSL